MASEFNLVKLRCETLARLRDFAARQETQAPARNSGSRVSPDLAICVLLDRWESHLMRSKRARHAVPTVISADSMQTTIEGISDSA